MDEHHFELFAERLRSMNGIWNAGFRWGIFWGFLISFLSVVTIGWLLGI